jgi:hypothetical protein
MTPHTTFAIRDAQTAKARPPRAAPWWLCWGWWRCAAGGRASVGLVGVAFRWGCRLGLAGQRRECRRRPMGPVGRGGGVNQRGQVRAMPVSGCPPAWAERAWGPGSHIDRAA